MNDSSQTIPYSNLALSFIPVVLVIIILWKWKTSYGNSIYAVFRMRR